MKKIFFIASYPKSGNTLIRILLSTYFYSNNGIYTQDLLKKIEEFPTDFFQHQLNNDIFEEAKLWNKKILNVNNNTDKFIFLKTHSSNVHLENKFFTIDKNYTNSIIYIYRDPRNIVLSLKDFFDFSLNDAIKYIINKNNIICHKIKNQNLSKGYVPILDWESHYQSFKTDQSNNIFFVKYENLVENTFEELKKILHFLKKNINFTIDDLKIKKTIDSSQFKNLQMIEKKEGFAETTKMGVSGKNLFFNKGLKRNFSEELDDDKILFLNNIFKTTLKELGYSL